jgi:hypothetical protein
MTDWTTSRSGNYARRHRHLSRDCAHLPDDRARPVRECEDLPLCEWCDPESDPTADAGAANAHYLAAVDAEVEVPTDGSRVGENTGPASEGSR